jgi:drug/metabolite transporter superfamily protein YnfA
MSSKTAQWILWAITMTILSVLALGRHFDALAVAIIVSSLVWHKVVSRAASTRRG